MLALLQLLGPARDLGRVDGRDVLVTSIMAVEGRDGPSGVYVEGLRDDDGRRIGIRFSVRNWHEFRDRVEQKLYDAAQRRHRRPAAGQKPLPLGEE